ncbi:hypothetical protein PPIS_a2664 [Pseudoalteromonas piscicida]|uniref:Uncharacterized protein n=1 Tax=Pseudoalteromonas piscicida TaxID=43662 RepID=A0ABN5CKP1_PSEO7|nr:hypothetical protein PPIS_a2664 [Pseudoalteromonas piscicida]
MEVNSTQLALKLAARKALIIRSSGYLVYPAKKGSCNASLLSILYQLY